MNGKGVAMTRRQRKWLIVSPATHTRIMKLKYDLQMRTTDELINFLIDFYLKHSS